MQELLMTEFEKIKVIFVMFKKTIITIPNENQN